MTTFRRHAVRKDQKQVSPSVTAGRLVVQPPRGSPVALPRSTYLHAHIGVRCVRDLRRQRGEAFPTPPTDRLLAKVKDHSLPRLHHDILLREAGELQLIGAGGQLGDGVAIRIVGTLLARLLVEDVH